MDWIKDARRLIAAVCAGTLCALAVSTAAVAQNQPIPPEHYTLDPRGVDLVSGTFNYGTTEVSIGPPGAGGLSYGRVFVGNGWRDASSGDVSHGFNEMTVSVGPISEVFVRDGGGNWVSKYDNGSTVVENGLITTVTDRHGAVAVFNADIGESGQVYPGAVGLITSHTSPDGRVTSYHYGEAVYCGFYSPGGQCRSYEIAYRLSSVTNNHGYMIKYTYWSEVYESGSWGTVKSVTGLNTAIDYCPPVSSTCPTYSRTWPSVTYDQSGALPLTAEDQSGRETTYSYSSGLLAGIRYPGSTSDDVAVTYDLQLGAVVTEVTDASGTWTYDYAVSTNQITTVEGPLGQSLTVDVDQTLGRATSVTDALNRTWSYQYDADKRVTRVTQPEGDYAAYTYDGRSNQTSTTWTPKSGSGLSAVSVSTAYPSSCASPVTPVTCNRPLSVTDARGGVTDYDWDETTGQLVSVTAPAPTGGAARPQTRVAYDDFQARYKNSATTFVNGSPILLPVEVSACATGVSCDGAANEILTTTIWPTTSTANNLLPTSTSRGSGATPAMATTSMTWTPDGDAATVDGPLSGAADTVTYIRDNARQVVGVIGPDPDGGGALLNRAQRITYNSRGQVTLTETGTASGGNWANFSPLLKSQITYDAADYFRPVESRQLSGAGAVSGVQSVSYDAAGRPSCTAVRMNPASYTSLPTSACTAATTGSFGPDRITQVSYDAVGRAVSTTSAYGTADALTESVTFTSNGRAASLTDGRGNVSVMEYDGFDRLAKLRYPNATGGGTSTTDYEQYSYDAAGQPLTSRDRAGQTTALVWDPLGRVTSIDAPSGTMDVAATYDNLGRTLTTTGNSQTLTHVWDALSRPVSETGPLGAMAYQYDPAGRMTRITWPDAFYAAYDHDVVGAVTAVRENGAPSGAGVLAQYAYDNLGQLTGVARADGAGAATTWGYDAFAWLTSLAQNPGGTAEDVTLGFSYNPAGQIVGRTVSNSAYVWAPVTGTTGYTLNGLNQVTQIDSTSITYDANRNATSMPGATYGYDAANRLTSASAGAGSATFAFDPGGRLYQSSVGSMATRFQYAGQQLVGEYDGAGNITARHIPGLGLDDIAASWDLSSTSPVQVWPLADERGSVVARAGSTGSVSTINRYDEYGVSASGNTGRFQYTGQAWLAEAGAYHYRARTYLPQIGRFGQPDPIGYAAGANLYAYVGADPVNYTDPLGLQQEPPCLPPECARLPGTTVTGVRLNFAALTVTFGDFDPFQLVGFQDQTGGGGDGTFCPAVPFRFTGVGPNQAPGVSSISQQPRASFPPGAVAIKPANFGIGSLSGSPSTPGSVRWTLNNISLWVDWSSTSRPSSGAPAIPAGIPTYTGYTPVDVIGPASVRNSPGNHIDLYGFTSQTDAFASTRTVRIRAYIPANNVGVTCPQ